MMRKRTNSGSREELPRSIGLGDSGTPDLPERDEEDLSGFGSDGLACHPQPENQECSAPQPRPSEVFERHFGSEHGVDLPELHRYGIQDTSEDPCIEES